MLIAKVLGASEVWAAWVVAVTWQLAALAVVGWVCERVLRLRQAGARYGLWWFVLVAPLVLAPTRMALERREAVVRVAAPAAVEQAVARVRLPAVAPIERAGPEVSASAASVPEASWWSRVRPADVLAIAWALGCLLLVARLVVGHARARRLVDQSRAVDDGEAFGALAELCVEAEVRRDVGLRVSSSVGAPVLYGVRRPAILLPEDWVESLATDDLRALLAHEVAHVRRGDCLANLVQRIVEIPLFFHPGAWLASRRVTLAREELADGWALARGVEASSYARSLAAMAERTQARLGAVSVGVAEGKSTLLRRVEAIMRGGSLAHLSLRLSVALLLIGALMATGLAMFQVVAASDEGKESNGAAVEVLPPGAALSPRGLDSVLSTAGLRSYRFSYQFDRPHQLHFTLEEYVDGVKGGRGPSSGGCGMAGLSPGKQTVLIVTRREKGTIGFSFTAGGGGSGLSGFEIDEEGGHTSGLVRGAKLEVGRRVPIFFHASDRESVGGIDALDEIIAEYDRVIVVLAEVVLPEEEEGGAFTLESSDVGGKRVSIDVRDVSIEDVLRMLSARSGTTIVADDASGRISLNVEDMPVERVLDAICAAKDLHWKQESTGVYSLSAAPRSSRPVSPSSPQPATDSEGVVYAVIDLKHMDATFVAWLFGKAELPKGFLLPFGATGDYTRAIETTEDREGGGALANFLPDGIELLAAVAYRSQQLVVAGTPQAIAELRELIGMIDRKPQQVMLECQYSAGLPANLDTSDLWTAQGGEHSLSVIPWEDDWGDPRPPAGVEPGSCRVATMNLLSATIAVPVPTSQGQGLLVASPRINGDGTITVYVEVREMESNRREGDGEALAATTTRRTQTTVNVRDGESFGLLVSVGGEWETVIVTPRIVREGRTEG